MTCPTKCPSNMQQIYKEYIFQSLCPTKYPTNVPEFCFNSWRNVLTYCNGYILIVCPTKCQTIYKEQNIYFFYVRRNLQQIYHEYLFQFSTYFLILFNYFPLKFFFLHFISLTVGIILKMLCRVTTNYYFPVFFSSYPLWLW